FGEKRYWVGLKEMCGDMREGGVGVEEKRFYEDDGFDVKGMGGAGVGDIGGMGKVEGARRMREEYGGNVYLDDDKTWKR
ncbi:transglycosylase domain-containing protein, partial [Bacillus pumilus]|uniref:transglycosylase domain-containing protein n=1 Tax=Bacillus pumilus TaxID=1408 RepID=UPI001C931577